MIRTIRIWLLLRKLQAELLEVEAKRTDHAKETGHQYSANCTELEFLEEVTSGDSKKMKLYERYLSIADKQMGLLKVSERQMSCVNCGCHTGPNTKWIRLNDAGIEFIGWFDLTEYILKKYSLTWGLLATIALSPVWIPLLSSYVFHPICVAVRLCQV